MAEQISIRHVGGYALVSPNPDVNIRHVGGYAIYSPPSTLDRTKTGMALLRAMIMKETLIAFKESDLVFAAPQNNTTQRDRNTMIVVTPFQIPYQGNATFFYNRIRFEDYFPDKAWKLTVAQNTTLHTLLPAINVAYGCNLVTSDVVDQAVSKDITTMVLTAAETNVLCLPGSVVRLGTLPQDPPLSSVVTVTDLPGFEAVTA